MTSIGKEQHELRDLACLKCAVLVVPNAHPAYVSKEEFDHIQAMHQPAQEGHPRSSAERELVQLEQSLERLTDLCINEGRLSKEQYTQWHRKLTAQIHAAEDKLHRQVPYIHSLEKALKRMDEIVETLKNGTPAQQREAIEALIQKVETRGGEITSVGLRPWAKPFQNNTILARRVLKTKPCNSSGLEDFVVTELRLERPRRGTQPRDLRAIGTVEELPRYLAEVVQAVADGIQTTREFAARQNVSIGAVCERFRVARKLGWIKINDSDGSARSAFQYSINR